MKLKNKVQAVKEVKSYGTLNLNSQDYPEIADLSIGDVKTCVITSEVTSLRKPDRWEISEQKMKPTDVIARVEIRKIEMPPKKKSDPKKVTGY